MSGPTRIEVVQGGPLGATPAANSLILYGIAQRAGGAGLPAGFTQLYLGGTPSPMRVGWKLATGASGEGHSQFTPPSGGQIVIAVYAPGASVAEDGTGGATGTVVTCGGAITPALDSEVWGFAVNQWFFGMTFTPDGAGETTARNTIDPTGNPPGFWAAYKATTASVAATITGTLAASQIWAGYSVAIAGVTDPLVPGVVVDFDDDGFDVGSDDILTPDVMDWTITRGASAEITGGANPGSATFHVRDKARTGKYNPRNASSPLYPNLHDGLRVHIAVNDDGTLTAGGNVKGLFAGRTTDISVLADAGPNPAIVTEFACEDPLAWYQRTPVHITDSRTRSHRELRLAILDSTGETRTDLDNEIGTMPLSSAEGDAFGVLGRINQANGTRHFAKPKDDAADWYAYTTYNRQHKLSGTSDASVDAGSDHATETSGWKLSGDTVTNQQRAAVDTIAFLDAERIVWTHDALPLIVSGTVDVWVEYPDYTENATIEYERTGTAPTVTLTSFGRTAKITLTSAGTTTFTLLRIRGNEVVRGDVQEFVADDLTSQALPRGVRAGSDITGDYVGVLAMARGIAQHVVWRYGTPQLRPTLTIENWFPDMFERDLYDVIDVTSLNLGSDAVLFEIVGLTHVGHIASPTVVHHTVTYVLQECRVQTDPGWFILDSSHLDPGTDVLAY